MSHEKKSGYEPVLDITDTATDRHAIVSIPSPDETFETFSRRVTVAFSGDVQETSPVLFHLFVFVKTRWEPVTPENYHRLLIANAKWELVTPENYHRLLIANATVRRTIVSPVTTGCTCILL